MGNEQSVPAPHRRPANKLSKPRTNSSAPIPKSPIPNSRQNSSLFLDSVGSSKVQTSSLSVNLDGQTGKKKEKRTSIFRSKSSQAKVPQLEITNSANIDYLNDSPQRIPGG